MRHNLHTKERLIVVGTRPKLLHIAQEAADDTRQLIPLVADGVAGIPGYTRQIERRSIIQVDLKDPKDS